MADPALNLVPLGGDAATVALRGTWTLSSLADILTTLTKELELHSGDPRLSWDLRGIDYLDSAGAMLIWRAWGHERKPQALLRPDQEAVFRRLARVPHVPPARRRIDLLEPIAFIGRQEGLLLGNATGLVALIGNLILDALYIVMRPGLFPWKEVSASIYKAGAMALPVTALVGFLIGVVISYLSALTLQSYGAGIYIIDILGISIVRELGPLLVAILLAGRSGSAMTAQIGVMRVTEEIDAMAIMGLSPTLRLVLPKIIGLAIAMPLVSYWAILAALLGGWLAAYVQLGISFQFFFDSLPQSMHPANLWIALVKSVSFGAVIALVACHFGLRVKPNTESVSSGITNAVVTSITLVILLDAVYAILFRDVGFWI